jgi:hypothetical protein
MRRALSVVALMALPIAAVSVGWTGVAGASTRVATATTGVACSKISGGIGGTTGKLSGCSDSANTGGSGTFPIAALTGGSGSITWHGTVGTTALSGVTATATTTNKCPTGDTEYEVSGKVSGGTGKSLKSIKKGWTLQAFVCVTASGNFSLLKGQKVNIGPKF